MMLQTVSIKSLALRVLQETTDRSASRKVCPTAETQVGQDVGQPTSPANATVPLRDAACPELCERMEASERQFGQPHANLFLLIGKRVWTPQGIGKLLSVFATRCEVWPDDAERTIRVRPEEVSLIQ